MLKVLYCLGTKTGSGTVGGAIILNANIAQSVVPESSYELINAIGNLIAAKLKRPAFNSPL
jgi:hypothetical protein